MARGVAVAAADATALPATCGDAAELFDPLDADAIAAAVLRARARRDELAAARAASAPALFTWDATAAGDGRSSDREPAASPPSASPRRARP